MKTITHEAKRIGSTRSSSGMIAVLLTLSWCVQASGEIQASPPKRSAAAAENQAAATPAARPEVWLCAGGRIAELLRPDAEWPFVSWYPHPKQMAPESAPHSMTALVRRVVQRVRSGAPDPVQRVAEHERAIRQPLALTEEAPP